MMAKLLERYKSFDISIIQRERGIKLFVKGALRAPSLMA